MILPEFPRALLREKSHSWNLRGVAAAGGQTASSVSPIVRSDGGGFWICSMSDISLSGNGSAVGRDRQKLSTLLWRAVRQICDGGVGAIIVPRNDALFVPWPASLPRSTTGTLHSDGTPFADTARYYQSVIGIRTSEDADLRDTSLTIELLLSGPLQGGEAFSIEHQTIGWRMYEIATVTPIDDTHASITFNPPLREDVASGTRLEFDRPCCVMRLAKPESMDLSVVPWTFNQASVDFVEAFP
jgi:hypothetical protein